MRTIQAWSQAQGEFLTRFRLRHSSGAWGMCVDGTKEPEDIEDWRAPRR